MASNQRVAYISGFPFPRPLAASAMKTFLESSLWVDWKTPSVRNQARLLAAGASSEEELARRGFEFVRDEIDHSGDIRRGPVTCRASDVLAQRTGYCYAKSHLLAALLRANGIPAGLCYQRLSLRGDGAPYCLHGLNAVHLAAYGWVRIDARGNKPGVKARFTPPVEALAFAITEDQERDFDEIWPEPLPVVVEALTRAPDLEALHRALPDIAVLPHFSARFAEGQS